MPAVGLATPLFLLLNSVKFVDCGAGVHTLTPLPRVQRVLLESCCLIFATHSSVLVLR